MQRLKLIIPYEIKRDAMFFHTEIANGARARAKSNLWRGILMGNVLIDFPEPLHHALRLEKAHSGEDMKQIIIEAVRTHCETKRAMRDKVLRNQGSSFQGGC